MVTTELGNQKEEEMFYEHRNDLLEQANAPRAHWRGGGGNSTNSISSSRELIDKGSHKNKCKLKWTVSFWWIGSGERERLSEREWEIKVN